MKEINYLFDVDGTLTPSRGVIDSEFKKWFINFASVKSVILVTGSDRDKTLEQLGESIYKKCKRVYNCSGNDVYEQDKQIKFNDWKLPIDAQQWLQFKLDHSPFDLRTGLHFEHRPGMVNFSIVGRNATIGERKLYVKHDQLINERNTIAKLFNAKFPTILAQPGGETGIDIYPKGYDKSQIIKDFSDSDNLYFFGDRMDVDGNDFTLAEAIKLKHGITYQVNDWIDTWNHLKEII